MNTDNGHAVLLVPGSWHGAWAYEEVRSGLEAAGVPARAIDLPSNGGAGGLPEDAEAVRRALDELDAPTVVVAHSYGGIAASEGAAVAPNAIALVYLCAFMLDAGSSLLDAMQHQLPPWLAVDEETGTCLPDQSEQVLYADCSAEVAAAAAARLVPQSLGALAAAQTRAAWRELPSAYLICEDDRAVPPAAQAAMAANADLVERLRASHSPFLSRPEAVVELIRRTPARG